MSLATAFYEQRFELLFLRSKGDAFQTFFETLMGFAYPGDFMACRPWGKVGDYKNDGFLQSERCLFQVYAPNEMTAANAIKKITEDFEGAKPYWGKLFEKWVFVHNAIDGLPPHVQKCILELNQAHPDITLETWGYYELLVIFRQLGDAEKTSWLGPVPNAQAVLNLGFKDIQVVIETLEKKAIPTSVPVRDVPAGKIECNALSENTEQLLKAGMLKSSLVQHFFETWHDETLGERLAESFHEQYRELRDQELAPDLIFSELQKWTGGNQHGTPEHEVAVLAVLAYYFDSCDIFESPRGDDA